ncbi:hypothetical protein CRYUN_Cryun17cG0013000 [Craigia yunnanensis]
MQYFDHDSFTFGSADVETSKFFDSSPVLDGLHKAHSSRPKVLSDSTSVIFSIVYLSRREEKKTEVNEPSEQAPGVSCSSPDLQCMDKLREELSCAICLDICFEPSTTPCRHSFCKKCLRSAADKCGKRCPKYRQLIRKSARALNSREVEFQSQESGSRSTRRTRSVRPPLVCTGDASVRTIRVMSQNEDAELALRLQREDLSRVASTDASMRRRGTPSQDDDAALALRLQREEFMESFRGTPHQQTRTPLSLARAN